MLDDVAAREGITVVDLIDVFCPGDVCDYRGENGVILYRDAFSHPSVEAARLSGPVIRQAVLAPPPQQGLSVAYDEGSPRAPAGLRADKRTPATTTPASE